METNKLLTIVIPVYNTEKYLRKCLDSLIVPSFLSSLDIIVVIDGSPDNSASIAREYEQKYPQTFRVIEKENGGHGSCCNVGLQQAEGKYIRFLDSDDWFDSDGFPFFLQNLAASEVDLVQTVCVSEYVGDGKSVVENNYTGLLNRVWDANTFDSSSFKYFLTLSNSTFRTICLHKAQVSFTEKAPFDDVALFIRPMIAIQSILFLDLKVYHYFIGRTGQSIARSSQTIKSVEAREKEFYRLCNEYSLYRKDLSAQKKDYADRLINTCIIPTFYNVCLSLPYHEAIKIVKRWNCQIMGHPFIHRTNKYYLITKLGLGWLVKPLKSIAHLLVRE